jgi:hypothetical protein
VQKALKNKSKSIEAIQTFQLKLFSFFPSRQNYQKIVLSMTMATLQLHVMLLRVMKNDFFQHHVCTNNSIFLSEQVSERKNKQKNSISI